MKSTKTYIKRIKHKKKLVFAFIIVFLLALIIYKKPFESLNNFIEEKKYGLTEITWNYDVMEGNENNCQIVFKIQCNYGLKEIKCPNGNIITIKGRKQIGIDYKIEKNQQYEFKIKTDSNDEEYTYVFNSNTVWEKKPKVELINPLTISYSYVNTVLNYNINEVIENNRIKTDISKSKYMFTKSANQPAIGDSAWDNANQLTAISGSCIREFTNSELGTWYLHILAVNCVGGYTSFVSDAITISRAPLYLFNEGPVDGYEWTRVRAAGGENAGGISNGTIWTTDTNYTWYPQIWKIQKVDLTDFSKIYMEVTTGISPPPAGANTQRISIGLGGEASGSGSTTVLTATGDSLTRQTVSANLGSVARYEVPLYLRFDRWYNPGSYVHKIWLE